MTQQAFHDALLAPGTAAPSGLHTCNGSDPSARFAVYRNNVLSSLSAALADQFPVVQALVGEAFFAAMAQAYVVAEPPASPLLVRYGEGMPEFIARFAPAAELPYLADVARLELLRVSAYHAADADGLSHEQLATELNTAQDPALLVFHLHPSLQLLSSAYATYSLWAAHQGELALEQVNPCQPEHCLVLRPHLEVLVIAVDAASLAFIGQLHSGQSLGQAAADCPADFDLSATLAVLMRHGAITGLSLSSTTCE